MLNLVDGQLDCETALKMYFKAWAALTSGDQLSALADLAIPTTLSWKVADRDILYKVLSSNSSIIEQAHIGTVNDRYIASAVLSEPFKDLWILKILERRPGSDDPLGLDSIDFLVDDTSAVFNLLESSAANVQKQHNEVHDWISLRFGQGDQFEAKFTNHLVLDTAVKELRMSERAILAQLDKVPK